MTALIVCAIFFTAAVGAGVLWSNPRRLVNQVFGAISLTATLWMVCVLMALRAGQVPSDSPSGNPIPWLRANAALATFFPWLIWLLKESVLATEGTTAVRMLRRSAPWLLAAGLMTLIAFSNSYIPSGSTAESPQRGGGYLVYAASSFVLY